ncbi:MAG: hypothetical protein WBB34_20720 [Xanthobacteraceae bacterium]
MSWQLVLTLALLVVVAALVGVLPGRTQEVWQFAAAELHDIMQLVTVEVCARRSFAALAAPIAAAVSATMPNTPGSTDRRIVAFPIASPRGIIASPNERARR